MSIVKRAKRKQDYFYLKHNSGTRQKEKYVGTKIPKDIHGMKVGFLLEFFREEWVAKLQTIHDGYSAELVHMPKKKVLADSIDNFAIHFTYNTQRIEGPTMTFRETIDLLMFDVPPLKRPERERHEAQMHRKVFWRP